MILAAGIWAPLVYQYSVGGILFIAGLYLALRSGACNLHRRNDRYWFCVILVGLFAYLAVHIAVYILALFVLPNAAEMIQ